MQQHAPGPCSHGPGSCCYACPAGRPMRRLSVLPAQQVRDLPGRAHHLNGIAYIRPPLLQVAFRPRSSLSGLALPTLRSKISA
jgi:hypothetical protein